MRTSRSTTACATTLVASAARGWVAGPVVVELSMSSSRRSMRREISACPGMSSISKIAKML